MAQEILSWKSIYDSEGASAPYSGGSYDIGAVIATVTTTTSGQSSYVGIDTTASNPINTTSYATDSQLTLYGDDVSGTRSGITVSFEDDKSDSVTTGVTDLRFAINDIDAGSKTSFQDLVTIRATSTTGEPLTIEATPGSNFEVIHNSDGSVTLRAISGTNSWNDARSCSEISITGGDIASVSVEFATARNDFAANNIMISDMVFNTGKAVCFAAGTEIMTPDGVVQVDDLQEGDLVCTADHGVQRVRWMGRTEVAAARLASCPSQWPIRIEAGALGEGVPETDLVVSPMHRILVRSAIAQRMFGTNEVLISAKQLLPLEGVGYDQAPFGVVYYHVMLDQHDILFANGCEAESFYAGPQALRMIGAVGRAELAELGLAPGSDDAGRSLRPVPARLMIDGAKARKLIERHLKNGRAVVGADRAVAMRSKPVASARVPAFV